MLALLFVFGSMFVLFFHVNECNLSRMEYSVYVALMGMMEIVQYIIDGMSTVHK